MSDTTPTDNPADETGSDGADLLFLVDHDGVSTPIADGDAAPVDDLAVTPEEVAATAEELAAADDPSPGDEPADADREDDADEEAPAEDEFDSQPQPQPGSDEADADEADADEADADEAEGSDGPADPAEAEDSDEAADSEGSDEGEGSDHRAFSDGPEDSDDTGGFDEAPEPAVPAAFGLVFQAPVAPPTRRASRPAGSATPPSAPAPEAPEPAKQQAETATSADASDEGEEGDGSGRSRRRRGGRGRKARDKDEADASSAFAEEATAAAEASDDDGSESRGASTPHTADADGDDESGSSRRRRRRRRGAAGGEGDDPPGTTTRVRESRPRDEVASVKGSTRLEAKKQRRREGREAGRRRTIITEKEFLARRESVERTMVVRRQDGRTQIGVLEDGILVEHYVSRTTNASMAGNIYLGRVQNVLPSMEAAFVDIGRGRNAVLYAGEVNWDVAGLESGEAKRIENVLTSGESVLVQVTKDPIGHKGARLTSQISLPGRYLVYVPQGSMTGISRKLPDTERSRLKSILKQIVPADAGVIVRTAAEGASEDELRRDVERLAKTWEKVSKASASKSGKKGGAPSLLYSEPDLTVRVIRDVFNEDFASLVISGDEVWDEISSYVEDVAPDLAGRMTKWTSEQDIFTAHRVDEQLAKALDRKVYLPSGGSLVIDRTEAMTVIDVNTGKFVGSGGNLEETVTKNNLEAAEEIVRQLRLRDTGGIIVIDFIDMVLESNRDLVVRRLLECLGRDRTKHQVAEVTSLGLVQMTRKRVASGLLEVFSENCDCCNGRGVIVRGTPVDTPAEPADDRGHISGAGNGMTGAGSNSAGSGGSGRASRRGRSQSSQGDSKTAPQPTRNGPSAAQIAAAAHAAALKANGTNGTGTTGNGADTETDLGSDPAEPLAPAPAPADELADLLAGLPAAAETDTPEDPSEAAAPETEVVEREVPEREVLEGEVQEGEVEAVEAADSSLPDEPTPDAEPADQGAAQAADVKEDVKEEAKDEAPAQPKRGTRRGGRRRGRATAPAGPPRPATDA